MNLSLLATLAVLIGIGIAFALAVRAIGGNIGLVEDWKKAWRWYSTYAFVFLALLPDLFNGLLQGGYLSGTPVDEKFSWIAKVFIAGAFILRSIRQIKPPALPEWSSSGAPPEG